MTQSGENTSGTITSAGDALGNANLSEQELPIFDEMGNAIKNTDKGVRSSNSEDIEMEMEAFTEWSFLTEAVTGKIQLSSNLEIEIHTSQWNSSQHI